MTTFAPAWSTISLWERLAASSLVVVGHARRPIEWVDPDDGSGQRFAIAEVEVREVLRGDVRELVRVRVAGAKGPDGAGKGTPAGDLEEGGELLLLLAEDEPGDVPRYGLQFDSAFPVRDDVLRVPDDLPLGRHGRDREKLTIDVVREMLKEIDAEAEERRLAYEAVDGPGWADRPYPEVEEIGDPDEKDRPPRDAGPRDDQPTIDR
jgi:hypothetical protein